MAFHLVSSALLFWLAADPPILRIHATTNLVVDPPHRTSTGWILSGRLFDDDTGGPIVSRPVVLEVEGGPDGVKRTDYILTREDGTFRLPVQGPLGRYAVRARFEGDEFHDGARWQGEMDLSRRPLELRWQGPERLRRGQKARFRLRADSDGEPADVAVLLAGASGPLRLRDGAIEIEVTASGRGPQRLSASFPGDAEYAPASAELRYLVEVPVVVALWSEAPTELRRGDSLRLAGRIRDADGPLALASLQIRVLGRAVATVQADAMGEFSARIGTRDLPAGRLEIDAWFRPTASFYSETRSPPLVATLAEPEPPPLYAFALPALATLFSLGAWRLSRLWAVRRLSAAPARAQVKSVPPVGVGGVRLSGKPRLRRPTDLAIEGDVLDARTGQPIVDATVALGGLEHAASGGHYLVIGTPGRHTIVVAAPGYMPEKFAVQLPHRGQLRGIEVHLQPFRLRVLAEFRAAAAPLLSDPAQFDLQTPREIAHAGNQALRALAALVEATSYSARPAVADDVAQAKLLRERVLDRSEHVP